MRFDIDVSQHHLEWDELRARVAFAEEAGFQGAWIFDHFRPLYGNPKGPCMEAWTLLAALAGITSKIRLGALVTGVTYRHPSILAAGAVTVDQVSAGRLDFGIGAAWFEQEHIQLGVEFPSNRVRIQRLEDAINIARLLWTEDGVSYDGKQFSLKEATFDPKPNQRPHPPIWVGASGERVMLPLVGRLADVWHTYGHHEDIARKAGIVDAAAEKAGRDPASIARSTSLSISEDWDEVKSRAERYRSVGIETLIVSWPGEGRGRVEEFMTEVMPEFVS